MTTYSLGDRVLVREGREDRTATVYADRGNFLRVQFDGEDHLNAFKVPKARCRHLRTTAAPPARVAPMLPPEPSDGVREALERHVGPRAVPKPPKPWRSQAYMAYVRDQRQCCCCSHWGTPADPMVAHHHGPHAMGEKGSDSTCVPLKDSCHRYFHDHGVFQGYLTHQPLSRTETDRRARETQVRLIRQWCDNNDIETDAIIVEALTAALRER